MDDLKQKITVWTQKLGRFKYTILILLIGIGLMCIPFDTKSQSSEAHTPTAIELDLQIRLQEILACVEGVGQVSVLLSPETGVSHTYQTNTQSRISEDAEEHQYETVLMSGGGEENALISATHYPTYKGAVVVCQGADKASVKLAVIRAVSGVTGLGSDHITVIKMKGK